MNAVFGRGRFAGVAHMPGRKAKAPVPSSPRRNSLIGKVHVAKHDLGLSDDDYRGILFDETRQRSAADCSEAELVRVIERFKARGWVQAAPKGRSGTRPADHKLAAKARALWISLHHLNAIDDPREPALEAFAKRQLKCAKLQWADQRQMDRLIEAEKKIAERHGWSQQLAGVKPEATLIVLKRRLVEAILVKLHAEALAPGDWTVERAAFEFGGVRVQVILATASELDVVARVLGDALREGTRA